MTLRSQGGATQRTRDSAPAGPDGAIPAAVRPGSRLLTPRRTSLVLGVALPVVVLFIVMTSSAPYWAVLVSTIVYAAAVVTVPTARPVAPVLSPRNLSLAAWGLMLVVLPALINVVRPSLGTLTTMPTPHFVNLAILLDVVAFVAFQLGAVCVSGRSRGPRRSPVGVGSTAVVLSFAAVGVLGLSLRVGSPQGLLGYFQGQVDTTRISGLSGPVKLLATSGPPFLSFAFVLVIDRLRRAGRLTWPSAAGCLVGIFLPLAVYSYNRISVVGPVLALLGAYGLLAAKRRTGLAVMLLVGLLIAAYQVGNFRREVLATQGGRYSTAEIGLDWQPPLAPLDTFQLYGQSPQFSAFALEARPAEKVPGQMLWSSVMAPLPGIGEAYRDASGTTLYNMAIYGTPAVRDQVLPASVEAWWSLGLPGILLVFGLLGALLEAAHRSFVRATSFVAAYASMLVGVWIGLAPLLSVQVLSQIFFYFGLPLLVFQVWARLPRATGLSSVPATENAFTPASGPAPPVHRTESHRGRA